MLFWKDKCVWIHLSCLNLSKTEYCSIFITTLEKHQNEIPRLHVAGRMWFGCLCVDSPRGTGTMSGEAAQAHNSLPWAPGNPLEMLNCWIYINLYKLCKSAVAHRCGLGCSHAVRTTSRWADTGFIPCNRWFCCRGFGRQLLLGVGAVGALVCRPVPSCPPCPASACRGTKRGAELRAYVSRRNPALASQIKRLKTLTWDNYKRKINLFLDQKLLCKRVCKLWRTS